MSPRGSILITLGNIFHKYEMIGMGDDNERSFSALILNDCDSFDLTLWITLGYYNKFIMAEKSYFSVSLWTLEAIGKFF